MYIPNKGEYYKTFLLYQIYITSTNNLLHQAIANQFNKSNPEPSSEYLNHNISL